MAEKPKAPVLDPATVAPKPKGLTGYPAALRPAVAGRQKRILGDALGLKQFGVNLTTLDPGAASALRHWHTHEDEFVYVVDGELVLITEAGETVLKPGMCAGFPAGKRDGHHLVNRTKKPARFLEVGTRDEGRDEVFYSDHDLELRQGPGKRVFVHKDGKKWE